MSQNSCSPNRAGHPCYRSSCQYKQQEYLWLSHACHRSCVSTLRGCRALAKSAACSMSLLRSPSMKRVSGKWNVPLAPRQLAVASLACFTVTVLLSNCYCVAAIVGDSHPAPLPLTVQRLGWESIPQVDVSLHWHLSGAIGTHQCRRSVRACCCKVMSPFRHRAVNSQAGGMSQRAETCDSGCRSLRSSCPAKAEMLVRTMCFAPCDGIHFACRPVLAFSVRAWWKQQQQCHRSGKADRS